jgi:type IX secretion system PorP/SprF family membrane protein
MKHFLLYISGVVLFFFQPLQAQDPHFSQYYANPLYLNPAFAGAERCPRLISNYRNQWPSISGQFSTSSISYDQHISFLQGGIGLQIVNDMAGEATFNTTSISLMYAYVFNVNRAFSIRTGLQAGLTQKLLNVSKLIFADQLNALQGQISPVSAETGINQSITYSDFSAGILGYSKNFYGGVAVNHLTQPNESIIEGGTSLLPMKITAHAGGIIPLNGYSERSISLSPNVLFHKQGNFTQLNVGLYALSRPITYGLWYRTSVTFDDKEKRDAIIALVGIKQPKYSIGFSYDFTLSDIGMGSGGSLEFSGSYIFPCKAQKAKKYRAMECPQF